MKGATKTHHQSKGRIHRDQKLDEQELAATAGIKNPNRFQRRAIAKQKAAQRKKGAIT